MAHGIKAQHPKPGMSHALTAVTITTKWENGKQVKVGSLKQYPEAGYSKDDEGGNTAQASIGSSFRAQVNNGWPAKRESRKYRVSRQL